MSAQPLTDSDAETSTADKLEMIRRVLAFRPRFTLAIICFGAITALLEGIGFGFLIPIIEIAQSGQSPSQADGPLGLFVRAYQFVGIPMTLETITLGVMGVMMARYTASFVVAWLREKLRRSYAGHLRVRGFDAAIDARVDYFDRHGSDEILNAVITQTDAASKSIRILVNAFERFLLVVMYAAVALYFAPVLTVLAVFALGGSILLIRYGLEPAFVVGDRVAQINEDIQTSAQGGIQGIRAVKLFGTGETLKTKFNALIDRYIDAKVTLRRNEAAVSDFQQLMNAVVIFGLVYAVISFTPLALTEIAVFLFAIFRLGPMVSSISGSVYELEGYLPHVVRTERFIEELERSAEPAGGQPAPSRIESVKFDDVSFTYGDEQVLRDISFDIERGEFAAFVGPSGAGKSTIISLLARLYEPDSGQITANETPIDQYELQSWRDRLAVVRQDPFLFDDTLRYNLTLGELDISESELHRVCDLAGVTEFFDELPAGYDSELGEDGVQLSGGQKQRVVLARALLREFEILILDEATSDLDTSIEAEVHNAIKTASIDATVVMVTHRLSTAESADRIYTVEDGEIAETGDHDELLDRDGTYAELYTAG
jgi:subfamily B ATP-binding cassette protein MsbA